MKHNLLYTTALVGAGFALAVPQASAQTVKLGVHGYMEQIVGVVFDREDAETGTTPSTSVTSVDQQTESEIFFKGSGKLDNGIEIIADVQMEVTGSPGNIIDEQYVIVRGSFGQLILGSEDNAGHLMTIGYQGSWATGVGQNLTFDVTDWIALPKNGGIPAGGRFDGTLNDPRLRSTENDSAKISYFTPRFAGFQLGGSYIPNFAQSTSTGPVGVATKERYHEGWAIGANYNGKFGDVGVGVAAGFVTAQSPGTNSVETATAWKNTDDMKAYNIAARFDFGPFRIAGTVKMNEDVRNGVGTSTTRSLDGTIYDVGARWQSGANAISFGYHHGEMEAEKSNPGDEEESAAMLSYARFLGPGVKWTANLIYADYEDDTTALNSSNSGFALTSSLRLTF